MWVGARLSMRRGTSTCPGRSSQARPMTLRINREEMFAPLMRHQGSVLGRGAGRGMIPNLGRDFVASSPLDRRPRNSAKCPTGWLGQVCPLWHWTIMCFGGRVNSSYGRAAKAPMPPNSTHGQDRLIALARGEETGVSTASMLAYANWSERSCRQMREGGVDAVHVTSSTTRTSAKRC